MCIRDRDSTALSNGQRIAYTVKFDRHAPVASASEAVRQEVDDGESVKTCLLYTSLFG